MAGANPAFFYTARCFGVNPVVICLTEQTHLEWHGRIAYLTAVMERRKTDLYGMDLIWAIAKTLQKVELPPPTMFELDHRPKDTRSAEQIKRDLLKKAGL